MSDQNLKAAEAFANDPLSLDLGSGPYQPRDVIDVERLARHIAARVAEERTRIRDRLIQKALELRCEAGKYKSHLVFHEIVACAMTLEEFAAELVEEDRRD